VVPDPHNPQDWDRFSYVRNNPVTYLDPGGNTPIIPLLIIGAVAILKVVDYGLTAYDIYQSSQVLSDPNASQTAKDMATANIAMAVAFEAAEPDELLPVSLPLDDLARRGIIRFGNDALGEGSERVLRETTEEITEGSFSIIDWRGYPDNIAPRPTGPFNILRGSDYNAARNMANNTNSSLHRLNPQISGQNMQIHEIHPVKFGGNPTSLSNKVLVPRAEHPRLTNWWRNIHKGVE
jgi:hypothetical protein